HGTLHFDTDQFGVREAYTVDGGKMGVLEYECFNAASAEVKIKGRSVHPGYAKDKMINAIYVAMEFNGFLPAIERPEHTTMYEGFFMLSTMEGGVDEARMKYIIRDHDRGMFEMRKGLFGRIATYLNEKYGEGTITLDIRDTYYNMAEVMKDHMDMIDRVKEKFAKLGVNCVTLPIRGGTDGAALSFRGIPCPNLCTGGYNFHGRYEFASVQEMKKCAELLIELVKFDD
ncbi:MAG: tripeptide aminopeptidase PepT, partial [Oscillospiraceae bacterium]|nr:tripeptide aminopeptidase PepT [Oscillospiraceae bacterium]